MYTYMLYEQGPSVYMYVCTSWEGEGYILLCYSSTVQLLSIQMYNMNGMEHLVQFGFYQH